VVALGLVLLGMVPGGALAQETPVIATTRDGVTVHGERYFGDLGLGTPLVLLFHQGGSNGRGEYAKIAAYLNAAGIRAIAWDQRSWGESYGAENRTVLGLGGTSSTDYCSAYPDLPAALDHVKSHGLAEKVIAWGSSYSGALVFRLAEEAERISGVVAFSPASGDPMAGCLARAWLDRVDSRTGHDMAAVRADVVNWVRRLASR